MLNIVAILLVLAAVFAFINHRYIKLPSTIGVMALALVVSLALAVLSSLGFEGLHDYMEDLLKSIDFTAVLMQGMLSLLLFAGALHVDLGKLRTHCDQARTTCERQGIGYVQLTTDRPLEIALFDFLRQRMERSKRRRVTTPKVREAVRAAA